MYQGKFDKKNKNTTVSVHELVEARNSAQAAAKETAARQAAAPRRPAPQPDTGRKPAPGRDASGRKPVNAASARQQAAQKQPVRQEISQEPEKRRGPRLGGVIFYTLYFMFIFLFFVGVFFGLQWFHGWLSDYEAAQPTVKSQEVFQSLFADPDWGTLYDAAGIQDTTYESKDAFVAYMEEKVGDAELTYQETSAGLSRGKKYFVKLGTEKLASFTLVAEGDDENITDITYIPDWQLGEVQLFFERGAGFRIQKQEGHTVYVNGIPLSDEHTIQMNTIRGGDNFLPAGATVPGTSIQQVEGLMVRPTVTIFDEKNNEMPVVYDEEQGLFIEQTQANTISAEEEEVALNAIKVYAEYQIKEASTGNVAKYFDSTGEAYKSIMQTVLTWTKGNNGYSFDNDSITSYNRYSDSLFSVYASTELTIKLTDGGTTEKPIHATLLFSKQGGSWKVIRMTNADIGEPVGKVRLTFMGADNTTVLSTDFYETDLTTLDAPILSAPAGKVFSGWVKEIQNDDGSKTLALMFQPDENGVVTLPRGTVLEPMTLYPLFEDADAATEGA